MLAVRPAGQEGADGERCWVNLRSADASYKQARSKGPQRHCLGLARLARGEPAAARALAPPLASPDKPWRGEHVAPKQCGPPSWPPSWSASHHPVLPRAWCWKQLAKLRKARLHMARHSGMHGCGCG